MIGIASLMSAMMTLPLPPPPYPFDRSIECRLYDFDGKRVATWSGKVVGVETKTTEGVSRFTLELSSSEADFAVPNSFPIPRGSEKFSLWRPSDYNRPFNPQEVHYRARLSYDFQLPNDWHGDWLVNVNSQFEPIAAGLCQLRVIRPGAVSENEGTK